MIRFLLLGGQWGPVPWTALASLGGSFLGAAGLFVLLDPTWSTYPWVGALVSSGLAVSGAILVLLGIARRRRTSRQG